MASVTCVHEEQCSGKNVGPRAGAARSLGYRHIFQKIRPCILSSVNSNAAHLHIINHARRCDILLTQLLLHVNMALAYRVLTSIWKKIGSGGRGSGGSLAGVRLKITMLFECHPQKRFVKLTFRSQNCIRTESGAIL